jgi:hypothetical protein
VVFESSSGRFESLGSNRQARVLDYWRPNAAQQAQIQAGLSINSRGSRSKTVRGSDAKGWTTANKRAGYQSARFITFEEVWSIEGTPGLPRFVRNDVMGSATSESMEGSTVYQATGADQHVIKGTFQRDESRTGTFRLTRAGSVSSVKAEPEKARAAQRKSFLQSIGIEAPDFPGDASEEQVRTAIDDGSFSEDDRRELGLSFRRYLQNEFRKAGNDPARFRLEVDYLTDQMLEAFVDDGKSFEQILTMFANDEFRLP